MKRHLLPHKPHRDFESAAFKKGFQKIAGVDEAGRGSLAGPVVAACVILPFDSLTLAQGEPWQEGINDSKLLSPAQREECYSILVEKVLGFSVGIVDSKEIHQINILKASLKAMQLAVQSMSTRPDILLVDGRFQIPLEMEQRPIVNGDALSLSIAAASIIAKVTRDRLMKELGQEFPHFSFAQHKGYGTKRHLREIKTHGPTPIHRLTFRGVS